MTFAVGFASSLCLIAGLRFLSQVSYLKKNGMAALRCPLSHPAQEQPNTCCASPPSLSRPLPPTNQSHNRSGQAAAEVDAPTPPPPPRPFRSEQQQAAAASGSGMCVRACAWRASSGLRLTSSHLKQTQHPQNIPTQDAAPGRPWRSSSSRTRRSSGTWRRTRSARFVV